MWHETNPQADFIRAQQQFTAVIRDPQQAPWPQEIERSRMQIYTELFFNNFNDFLASQFPVLHEVITEPVWEALVRRFMRLHHCQTPIFAEIGREFIAFLQSEDFLDSALARQLPDFVLELAEYERLELVLATDMTTINWPKWQDEAYPDDALLQSQITPSPVSRLGIFRYPVQNISADFQPQGEDWGADKAPQYLLLYRDRQHELHFVSLTAVSAMLYQQLLQTPGQCLQDHLFELAKQLQISDQNGFIQSGLAIARQWCKDDVVYIFRGEKND